MTEQIKDIYVVNQKLYVNTKFLCAYFNRTDKQIGRWKKDGLPILEKPKEINKRGDFYSLEDAIEWVDKNVNKIKAGNSKGMEENNEDDKLEDLFNRYKKGNATEKGKVLLNLDQNTIDKFKKIEDIIEKEAKNKEYDIKYALKDDVKKGQQELASLFISLLKNSMPVLSKILENKNQNEIYLAMDQHFKKEMNKIVKYIKTNDEIIVTLNEIIDYIVYLVAEQNIKQEKILNKIKELS